LEKKVYDLVVDPELERVVPPLAENELEILKADILEHGCKFPLIVWGDMIVDGHNRYRICRENDIPFGIEQMEFSDKTEAKLWIVKNQLGRRNLRDFQRCEMVLPLENEIKAEVDSRKRAGISAARTGDQKVQKLAPSQKSREILAEMAGVSHATLDKVKTIIVEADEETLEKLRSGEMKIHTAYTAIRKKDKQGKPEAEPQEEAQDGKPPVAAAHLEGSIPFEPVQRDMPGKSAGMLQPLTRLDEPIEVPAMREAAEKTPYPFPYVKDQVRFAVKNMMKELQIAMNWLRDEDKDNIDELLQILDEGFEQAESFIKEAIA
jgi:hypothetical protein